MLPGNFFQTKHSVLLQTSLPEQVNLEGQREVEISEISYLSVYQTITEGNFKFFDEKISKSTSTYNLEPRLYTSITYIAQAMNTHIEEKNNHNETCITVKVSRRTQKIVIILQTMILVFHSEAPTWVTFLGKIWETNLGYL